MPSHEIGAEDYECPRCFNNAFPCGCYKKISARKGNRRTRRVLTEIEVIEKSLGKELNSLIGRIKRKFRENPLRARDGRLTYEVLADGTKKIRRWKFNQLIERNVLVELTPQEQEILAKLLQTSPFFMLKLKYDYWN